MDFTKPKTFSLIDKLSKNKKTNSFYMDEHMKNLSSLHRRLTEIKSVRVYFLTSQGRDRKKNPNDPIAYPSLFFRKNDELDASTSI